MSVREEHAAAASFSLTAVYTAKGEMWIFGDHMFTVFVCISLNVNQLLWKSCSRRILIPAMLQMISFHLRNRLSVRTLICFWLGSKRYLDKIHRAAVNIGCVDISEYRKHELAPRPYDHFPREPFS